MYILCTYYVHTYTYVLMCIHHNYTRTHTQIQKYVHKCICTYILTCMHVRIYVYVTGFGKTDHIVTIDISRNTDLKYRSRHGSLVLDCSHARFAI